MRIVFFIILQLFSIQEGATSVITDRCIVLLRELTNNGDSFARALKAEPDDDVRRDALIIYDDVRRHGAMTEIGAHGKDLSWKWLGVTAEGEGRDKKYKVVGYAMHVSTFSLRYSSSRRPYALL